MYVTSGATGTTAVAPKFLDTLIQGPLNIWTEHSNGQIHSRGDSKNLIALLIPNIFLIFTDEIISICI